MPDKVIYTGASDSQVTWGTCDDPRGVLVEGQCYEVEERDVRSWHTKLKLVGVEGRFNSVCFDEH
jgi:hypothetical protein